MNIYTVKWGSKYSAKHVNQIYESCKEYITQDFTFYCLTEKEQGLDKDINVIPFPADNKLEKWWNKMYLFDDNVVRQKGDNLFFDLDIIIQKNIDDIANFDPEDCLCFGQTHWHDLKTQKTETEHVPHRYTDLNSSILRWNDTLDKENITLYFKAHKEKILWYYRGLDNFFMHKGVARIKYFPLGWFYSYNYGYIFPHDVETHVFRQIPYVCLFDSMGRKEDVKF